MTNNQLSYKKILFNGIFTLLLTIALLNSIFVAFENDKDKTVMSVIGLVIVLQQNYQKIYFLLRNRDSLMKLLTHFDFIRKQKNFGKEEKSLRIQMKCFTFATVLNTVSLSASVTIIMYLLSFWSDGKEKPFIIAVQFPGTE